MIRLRDERPTERSSIPGADKKLSSSPKSADRLWGPPIAGDCLHDATLTTYVHLVTGLRMCGATPPSAIYLHGGRTKTTLRQVSMTSHPKVGLLTVVARIKTILSLSWRLQTAVTGTHENVSDLGNGGTEEVEAVDVYE